MTTPDFEPTRNRDGGGYLLQRRAERAGSARALWSISKSWPPSDLSPTDCGGLIAPWRNRRQAVTGAAAL